MILLMVGFASSNSKYINCLLKLYFEAHVSMLELDGWSCNGYYYYYYYQFIQKDRGRTKGEPVLGAPQYTHTYIQLQRQNTKNKQKL